MSASNKYRSSFEKRKQEDYVDGIGHEAIDVVVTSSKDTYDVDRLIKTQNPFSALNVLQKHLYVDPFSDDLVEFPAYCATQFPEYCATRFP